MDAATAGPRKFSIQKTFSAGEGDPSAPVIWNIAEDLTQVSGFAELSRLRVAVVGACPFRLVMCHGNSCLASLKEAWYGSELDKHQDVVGNHVSNWIGEKEHYATVDCGSCQVRLSESDGSFNVIIIWAGIAHDLATKIEVSGEYLGAWRPVAIKAAGKTVLDYQGGIQLGRKFGVSRASAAKLPVKAKDVKKKVKAAGKIIRKDVKHKAGKNVKAKGKIVKKVVKKKDVKKAWKSSL